MKVVDANVLAAYYLEDGERHRRSLVLLNGRVRCCAPDLWKTEYLSVLKKYVLHRGLNREAAVIAHAEADSEITTLSLDDPEMVLGLALESRCSVYDCEYVALALSFGVPLFTFDKAVIDAFPGVAREP